MIPETLLDKRMVNKYNKLIIEQLIKWQEDSVEDTTWEVAHKIREEFSTFDIWTQGSSYEGAIDMNLMVNQGRINKKDIVVTT